METKGVNPAAVARESQFGVLLTTGELWSPDLVVEAMPFHLFTFNYRYYVGLLSLLRDSESKWLWRKCRV